MLEFLQSGGTYKGGENLLTMLILWLLFSLVTLFVFLVVFVSGEVQQMSPTVKSKSQHYKEGILDKATPTWLTIFFLSFFCRLKLKDTFCVFLYVLCSLNILAAFE